MKEIVLPDITFIGIYNARLAYKNKDVTQNRKTTMFELELPIEFGGTSYINDDHQSITSGLFICAKPGQTRHTVLPFTCYFVHLTINGGALYDMLMSMPSYINIPNISVYEQIFKRLCKYYERGLDEDTVIMQGLILELIYSLYSICEKDILKNKIKSNNSKVVETVTEYIKNNLSSDLSLEALSNYASFSPIHFHNMFKSSTGMTLHDYIEERRMKKAINLLVGTDLTLSEIAYECGFSSQSYFSYAFKRRFGETPRQYTRKIFGLYDK